MKFGVEFEYLASKRQTKNNKYQITEMMDVAESAVGNTFPLHPIVRIMDKLLNKGTSWILGTDYSCGFEMTTPALFLTTQTTDKLKSFLNEFLLHFDSDKLFSSMTGLHVHVSRENMSREQVAQFINNIIYFEDYIFKNLVSNARKKNRYLGRMKTLCKYIYPYKTPAFKGFAINTRRNIPTIEFKYLQNSADTQMLINWLGFLAMIEEVSSDGYSFKGVDSNDVFEFLSSSEYVDLYVKKNKKNILQFIKKTILKD